LSAIIKIMNKKGALPYKLQVFFWDYYPSQIDIFKFKDFIIERLLEKGTLAEVKWLFKTYSDDDIKSAALNSPNLSTGTRTLWKKYFNATA